MSSSSSFLLASRCRVPDVPQNAVQRVKMVKRLEESDPALVTVSAPAGSGKTMLLAQWCEYATARASIWLSVEPNAHDGIRFWSYVILAVEQAFTDASTNAIRQGVQGRDAHATIALLINLLEKQHRPFMLVIDNIERILDDMIWQEIGYFLDNLPSSGRVVLSGRSAPRIPLSRTSINKHVVRLGFTKLAFDRAETEEFASKAFSGMVKSKRDELNYAELHDASGGWPALAYAMIAAWGENRLNPSEALNPQMDSLARDYLEEEVLVALPADTLQFLSLSSMLPYVTESAFCRVFGGVEKRLADSSRSHIAALYSEYCIFERIVGKGYLCNPALAAFLQAKLELQDKALYCKLSGRIADDLVQQGKASEAIPFAIAGESFDLASELILETYSQLGMSAGFSKLNTWLEAIPPENFQRYPELNIAKAMALIPFGKSKETEGLLAQAEQLLRERQQVEPRSAGDFMAYCEVPIIYAYNAAFALDRSEELLKFSAESRKELGTNRSRAIEGSVRLMEGVGSMLQGDFQHAEECFSLELKNLEGTDALFMPLLSAYYKAMVDYQRGLLAQARSTLLMAIERAGESDTTLRGIEGMLRILLAWVLYDLNEVSECRNQATRGMSYIREWRTPLAFADGYEVLSYALKALGDDEALARVRRNQQKELPGVSPLFIHLSTHERRSLERLDEEQSDGRPSSGLWHIWWMRYEAQANLERRDWASAEALLKRVADETRAQGLLGYVVEAQALRAILLSQLGSSHETIDEALSESLDIAEQNGHVRLFIDEGEPMRLLLSEARKRDVAPRFTAKLMRLFAEDAPNGANELLSSREQEILALLAVGHAPKEIAAILYVSVGTVRTHLHHIYAKLGVSGQREAILKAQHLGLACK